MKLTELYNYLDRRAKVILKLTGVSFGNCQDNITRMILNNWKNIILCVESDNPYDDYAISVKDEASSEKIGYIPKLSSFTISLRKRKRLISVNSLYDEKGNKLQTNQAFYDLAKNNQLEGKVNSFLNYGKSNIPIGVRIELSKV